MYPVALIIFFKINFCFTFDDLAVVNNKVTCEILKYCLVANIHFMFSLAENLTNYSTVPYLLDDSDRRRFIGNTNKKLIDSSPFEFWPPRWTDSFKGQRKQQTIFYTSLNAIIRDPVTNRNIEKAPIFPSKQITFKYNPTKQFPIANKIGYSKSNLLLREDNIPGGSETTRRSGWMEKTSEMKEIFKDSQSFFDQFKQCLELFDRKFYQITFTKLTDKSPQKENGISFVQSGLLLYLALMALSTEVDLITKLEIESCSLYPSSVAEKIKILKYITVWLPVSSDKLKLQWVSRVVLEEGLQVSQQFVDSVAGTIKLHVQQFKSTDTRDNVLNTLNEMVENDSAGSLRDTFIEDDFSQGLCSVLITTMYLRARWRVAPTVLNDTYPFKDNTTPQRSVKMIKLNDIMGYTDLTECDAEAIEINYATPGLTLLMLMPRGNTLKNLATYMETTTPQEISNKMVTIRIAAILPIYTLRMTLLLPEKLRSMNISRLVDAKPGSDDKCGELRLSHAAQHLMFWAEAGRDAFKDDGLEWDERPDLELIADRPYLFYVRWKNVTLMNGNFVL